MAKLRAELGAQTRRLEAVEARLNSLDTRVCELAFRIDRRFEALEERLDARFDKLEALIREALAK